MMAVGNWRLFIRICFILLFNRDLYQIVKMAVIILILFL